MKDGIGSFVQSVLNSLLGVAKIGHVWLSGLVGAALFGTMLAAGVVWMPKLLQVHGLSPTVGTLGASLLWLGLAVGSVVLVRWSDYIKRRDFPLSSASSLKS
jgi:amino acid permease